jgi:predicted HD superfamily hydrolase involved in NAD metabolism
MGPLATGVRGRLDRLPDWLQGHTQRVRDVAGPLAGLHGADPGAVDAGAAAHDLARAMSGEALLAEARRIGLEFGPAEERSPILLHGPIAARWVEEDGEVEDPRVIAAVRWHTTGSAGMDHVARVVFLADKIEPVKVARNPTLRRVVAAAQQGLGEALLELLNIELAYRAERGEDFHPSSIELREELMRTTLPASPGRAGNIT